MSDRGWSRESQTALTFAPKDRRSRHNEQMASPCKEKSGSESSPVSSLAQRLGGEVVRRRSTAEDALFVAIDGRSGSGKSTLAAALSAVLLARYDLTCAVIEGDQFYAGGTPEEWDQRTPSEKADLVIDWRRQSEVLKQLRNNGAASWLPFDWEASDWYSDNPPLANTPVTCEVSDVVVLEGAYSSRPELHDLLDIRVLLDTPADQRRRQLLEREGDAYRTEWEARWSSAENHYFGETMPSERFDVILQ